MVMKELHVIGDLPLGEAQSCEEGEAVKHEPQLQDPFQRTKVRAVQLGED